MTKAPAVSTARVSLPAMTICMCGLGCVGGSVFGPLVTPMRPSTTAKSCSRTRLRSTIVRCTISYSSLGHGETVQGNPELVECTKPHFICCCPG